MKALVVDASQEGRDVLLQYLTQLGFEVEHVASGFEALAKAPAIEGLRVLLCACRMPGMDGLELLRRIRADRGFDAVPVVLVACEADLPLLAEALEAGASECLVRPFDAQGVLEKLLLLGVDPEQRRAA